MRQCCTAVNMPMLDVTSSAVEINVASCVSCGESNFIPGLSKDVMNRRFFDMMDSARAVAPSYLVADTFAPAVMSASYISKLPAPQAASRGVLPCSSATFASSPPSMLPSLNFTSAPPPPPVGWGVGCKMQG